MSVAAAVGAGPEAPRPRVPGPGSLWRLALADVRERTRRPAYLVSLLVMAWLAHGMLPPAGAGYRTFSMNDLYRPGYGPEWVGTIVGVMSGLYFLLVGFYQVKGAVERDRRTGVGQVLMATPTPRWLYVAAKAASNFVVLASMLVVAFGVALVTQQLLGESHRFDPLATALPLFALALPVAALVSAGAVLIECVPGLAGGAGNVVWFVASIVMLSTGIVDSERGAGNGPDLLGVGAVTRSAFAALRAAHPEVPIRQKEVSMGINVSDRWKDHPAAPFPWRGIDWSAAALAERLAWFAGAAALVALAALVFDRFERPARVPAVRGTRVAGWFAGRGRARGPVRGPIAASALPPATRGSGFTGLVRAELALLVHGAPMPWLLIALGLVIATVFAPLAAVRSGLLPALAIWPVLLFGALGSRERQAGTGALLFSVARPVERLLGAAWLAGAITLLALGAPALLRLALAGEWAAAAGWLLGCAFVPALALALGVWTGGGKFFEVLYLFAWYMGPMHHIAAVDFTGVTAPRSAMLWTAYGALTAALLASAWAGRVRQVRR